MRSLDRGNDEVLVHGVYGGVRLEEFGAKLNIPVKDIPMKDINIPVKDIPVKGSSSTIWKKPTTRKLKKANPRHGRAGLRNY
jgi:hypothetical protein